MYYIHIDDPQFDSDDNPFGGCRRLGPFLTEEEATNQAVSDGAHGAGIAVGIYDEEGKQVLSGETIGHKAAAEAERRLAIAEHQRRDLADRDEAINKLLSVPGITVADLREAGVLA